MKILCLSRSYLSRLFPEMERRDKNNEYYHIVQTNSEAKHIKQAGGEVILNFEEIINSNSIRVSDLWEEPADFRTLTGFNWSPVNSDRYLPEFDNDLRLRVANILFKRIEILFKEYRFDAFISEPVALFVTHSIFYFCKKNNVKPLLWCNTYFSGYFYFANKIAISSPVRSSLMSKEEESKLKSIVSQYVQGIVNDKTGPVYHHAFSGTKNSILGYFHQRRGTQPLVLRLGWFSKIIQTARLTRAIIAKFLFPHHSDFITSASVREHYFYWKCLFLSSSNYDSMPTVLSKDNVVYPLQYEPEASLLYFAPQIINQISFVETILKSLPSNKILWVKEHPNQCGALQLSAWASLRKRYHNLRFIHGRQNGRTLIKLSSLLVTISSTMGLDGLLLGRKVLVAGDVFYRNFTGAFAVDSYESLSFELNQLSNYELCSNVSQIENELFSFGQKTYAGDPQPSTYLFSEENLLNLIHAVNCEIT